MTTAREYAERIAARIDQVRADRAARSGSESPDDAVAQIAAHITALDFPRPEEAPAGSGRLTNIELEQYALVSLLAEPGRIEEHISRGLGPQDYVVPAHQLIFGAIVTLWDAAGTVDLIAVATLLAGQPTYEEAGGKDYLVALARGCTDVSLAHGPRWSAILHDLAQRRRLAGVGPDMVRAAAQAPDVAAAIQQAEEILARSIKDTGSTVQSAHPSDILHEAEGDVSVSTGWPIVDYYTQGLSDGQVWTIMAGSSTGKTAFVLNIVHQCLRSGLCVAYFNLDSASIALMHRLVALEADVTHRDAKYAAGLQQHPLGARVRAAAALFERGGDWGDRLRVYSAFRDLNRILAEARRHKTQYGLDLVVVDFIQNISTGPTGGTEYERMNEVMRDFQQFVQLEGCAAILLSQIAIEQQKGQRATDASNGKGSGAIKDVADVSLQLYRDRFNESRAVQQRLEVKVLKVKEGDVGVIHMDMDLEKGRIETAALSLQPTAYQFFMANS